MKLGAQYLGKNKCDFVVWAPGKSSVELRISSPEEKKIQMSPSVEGYWKAAIDVTPDVSEYFYVLDGGEPRPDPASHFQPHGVHRSSRVVDHSKFQWNDERWRGIDLASLVFYEIHPGTFTPEGTFDAIVPRLRELHELGINAIELMPIAQFPGKRNWGYDGVHPFAPQNSYGGPDGLKRLVDACHQMGIAVFLDVVYNHLGPEGNYLAEFGPYFTQRYRTPWGLAMNFDGPHCHHVRNFFIESAIHWFEHYHIDGFRLDAVHAIYDASARTFLQELAERVEEFSRDMGRSFLLIAESNLNDTRLIRRREMGGFGLDAQWNDDLHHCIHTLLTCEKSGYYEDFGEFSQIVKAIREGFVYSGQYSKFRFRPHGNSSASLPGRQFLVFSQNHDQTGNRMMGERLATLVPFEASKLAASTVLLSPYVPLLFMGEEYGEINPFLYFVSHNDPGLIAAVREGRKEEFRSFKWIGDPPDPQAEETFQRCILAWDRRTEGHHRVLREFYRVLLRLRREHSALAHPDKEALEVTGFEQSRVLVLRRWRNSSHCAILLSFNDAECSISVPLSGRQWKKILDSSERQFDGPGALAPDKIVRGDVVRLQPYNCCVYLEDK